MLRSVNRSAAVRAVALVIVSAILNGCTLTTETNDPAQMVKTNGDQQTAAVNTVLPLPFEVIVVNQFGEPLKDVVVNWTITAGGGSISGTPTVTDETGKTSVTYTTGPTSGTATINAQVHGLFPVIFTVTIS
jgi:Bacterial Ig-like domain (group 1)